MKVTEMVIFHASAVCSNLIFTGPFHFSIPAGTTLQFCVSTVLLQVSKRLSCLHKLFPSGEFVNKDVVALFQVCLPKVAKLQISQ